MIDYLHHLLFPRSSNNHRSKLLHNSSLLVIIALLLSTQILLITVKSKFSNVLGTTTDISAAQILTFTNKDREQAGVSDLAINDQLSKAAYAKAQDMFAKDYWAHNAPDGTTPWVFIRGAGYDYVYAGENLARGFSTSKDVVDAWMASPSHRENMLSPNYKDVGFAVAQGKLLGEDTTLVVEEFGNTSAVIAQTPKTQPTSSNPQVNSDVILNPGIGSVVQHIPLIDSPSLTWTIAFSILSLFIMVLLIDMVVIERRKIVRFVGHNIDHILYLTSILIFVLMFTRGVV